jgi:predicted nucleic acid-binding protein
VTANLLVVADATPLIALAKIGQLAWLPDLFGEILVPDAVYTEIVIAGSGRSGAEEIRTANWIRVESLADRSKVNYLLVSPQPLIYAECISA